MIDLTLNEILIPDITGYINPYNFGTKIEKTVTNKGGLSSREVNNNILAPFAKMRAVVISSSDYTTEIEYDAKLIIDSSDSIELTLGNGQYIGCRVIIVNVTNYDHTLLCTSVSQENLVILRKIQTELFWNGTAWQNISAPSIGKRIAQYPQEKQPSLIYPCSSWELIDYNGAFLRTKGGFADNFIEAGQTLNLQSQGTSAGRFSFEAGNTTLETKDPQWELSWTGGYHNHSCVGYLDDSSDAGWDYWYSTGNQDCGLVNNNPGGDRYFSGIISSSGISISGTISGDHTHDFTPKGEFVSSDDETRPYNYSVKIWKRTA